MKLFLRIAIIYKFYKRHIMEKVLIVDDEEMNLNLATTILKKEPYELILARDGSEAIEVIKTTKISLIILDLMMPILNGFEVLNFLKNGYSDIPVIVVTALSDKDSVVKAIDLGADEYLIKPFDIIDLKLRVKNLIKLNRLSKLKEIKVSNEDNLIIYLFSILIGKVEGFNLTMIEDNKTIKDSASKLVNIFKLLNETKNLTKYDVILMINEKLKNDNYFESIKSNIDEFITTFKLFKL